MGELPKIESEFAVAARSRIDRHNEIGRSVISDAMKSMAEIRKEFHDYLRSLASFLGIPQEEIDAAPAHGNAPLRWAAMIQLRLNALLARVEEAYWLGIKNGGDNGTFDRDHDEIHAHQKRIFDAWLSEQDKEPKEWEEWTLQHPPPMCLAPLGTKSCTKEKGHQGVHAYASIVNEGTNCGYCEAWRGEPHDPKCIILPKEES